MPLIEDYRIEIFNELCTLSLSYFIMIYTDYLDDPYIKFKSGNVFIGVFIFNMFVNLIIIIR